MMITPPSQTHWTWKEGIFRLRDLQLTQLRTWEHHWSWDSVTATLWMAELWTSQIIWADERRMSNFPLFTQGLNKPWGSCGKPEHMAGAMVSIRRLSGPSRLCLPPTFSEVAGKLPSFSETGCYCKQCQPMGRCPDKHGLNGNQYLTEEEGESNGWSHSTNAMGYRGPPVSLRGSDLSPLSYILWVRTLGYHRAIWSMNRRQAC